MTIVLSHSRSVALISVGEMLEQIFKNLFSRKPVLPYPEGFKLKPGEEAIVVEFKQKIDPVFGRSLGQGS